MVVVAVVVAVVAVAVSTLPLRFPAPPAPQPRCPPPPTLPSASQSPSPSLASSSHHDIEEGGIATVIVVANVDDSNPGRGRLAHRSLRFLDELLSRLLPPPLRLGVNDSLSNLALRPSKIPSSLSLSLPLLRSSLSPLSLSLPSLVPSPSPRCKGNIHTGSLLTLSLRFPPSSPPMPLLTPECVDGKVLAVLRLPPPPPFFNSPTIPRPRALACRH